MRKWMNPLIILILFSLILIGCFNNQPNAEPKILRIFAPFPEDGIKSYTDLYQVKHPNVKFEIISTDQYRQERLNKKMSFSEFMKDVMASPNPPDVVFLLREQLPSFIEEGRLLPLDPFIDKTNFDLDGILPLIKDTLRELGDGTLYVLSPEFGVPALFYNKDIFDRMGVPYPTDRMTWEEVFNLARLLTHEENGDIEKGSYFLLMTLL